MTVWDALLVFLALCSCVCMLWWQAVKPRSRMVEWLAYSLLIYFWMAVFLFRVAPSDLWPAMLLIAPFAAIFGFGAVFPRWEIDLVSGLNAYFHPEEPPPPWRKAGQPKDEPPASTDQRP